MIVVLYSPIKAPYQFKHWASQAALFILNNPTDMLGARSLGKTDGAS
jgi:hypothetical protein